jgi:hypothetical protein
MAAAVAIGASLIFGTGVAHALTVGFDIINNSRQLWSICMTSTANTNDSGPGPGQQLAPWEKWHVEITIAGKDDYKTIRLCTVDGRVVEVTMGVEDTGQVNPTPSYYCSSNFCSQLGHVRGNQIYLVG